MQVKVLNSKGFTDVLAKCCTVQTLGQNMDESMRSGKNLKNRETSSMETHSERSSVVSDSSWNTCSTLDRL